MSIQLNRFQFDLVKIITARLLHTKCSLTPAGPLACFAYVLVANLVIALASPINVLCADFWFRSLPLHIYNHIHHSLAYSRLV